MSADGAYLGDNDGSGTPCAACKKAKGRPPCEYPPPTLLNKRTDSGQSMKQENDTEPRPERHKRPRMAAEPIRTQPGKTSDDPLDLHLLTQKVWDQLWKIFKRHFSTEMPFLHPVKFNKRLKAASNPRQNPIPEPDRLLLLGVLTLTARFHPELVAHHSNKGDPLPASMFYAHALANVVGNIPLVMTSPSIERVQATLMLALFAWGQSYGLSAWQYLGSALRLAQLMGLEYEDDPKETKSSAIRDSSDVKSVETRKEIRRRTLWSCFILDRSISNHKNCPPTLTKERLRVRLPKTENNFNFEADVSMEFLDTQWSRAFASAPRQFIEGRDLLSRHVQLEDIFGRCAAWSYPGGRRLEQYPPWDKRSTFHGLEQDLRVFHESLPSDLTYTESILSSHIESASSTIYASMHILYRLCLVMLHREYIPYIAFECDGPVGPIDEPTFPASIVPENHWEISADIIFSAAKEIVEIVTTLHERNELPESPLFIFAVYQALNITLYGYYFPQMDVEHHVSCPREVLEGEVPAKDYMEPTQTILRSLASRSLMAKYYLHFIKNNRQAIERAMAHFKKHGKVGKDRGGLIRYIEIEKDHKEFGGRLEDPERNIPDDGSDMTDPPPSRGSTLEYQNRSFTEEPATNIERTVTPRPSWATVNQPAHSVKEERPSYHGQSPIFQSSPRMASTAPSLISPGGSTPSVQSPYASHQPYYQGPPQLTATYTSNTSTSMLPPNVYAEAPYEPDLKLSGNPVVYSRATFDNFAQTQDGHAFGDLFQQITDMQQAGDAYEQSNPMVEAGYFFFGPGPGMEGSY